MRVCIAHLTCQNKAVDISQLSVIFHFKYLAICQATRQDRAETPFFFSLHCGKSEVSNAGSEKCPEVGTVNYFRVTNYKMRGHIPRWQPPWGWPSFLLASTQVGVKLGRRHLYQCVRTLIPLWENSSQHRQFCPLKLQLQTLFSSKVTFVQTIFASVFTVQTFPFHLLLHRFSFHV